MVHFSGSAIAAHVRQRIHRAGDGYPCPAPGRVPHGVLRPFGHRALLARPDPAGQRSVGTEWAWPCAGRGCPNTRQATDTGTNETVRDFVRNTTGDVTEFMLAVTDFARPPKRFLRYD